MGITHSRLLWAFFVAVFSIGSLPTLASAADDPDHANLARLQAERLEAAREFAAATIEAFERDTMTMDVVVLSIREMQLAELEVARSPKERITAHARALTGAQRLEAHVRRLFDVGARGGEADKFAQAKTARLQAEIDLAREKLALAPDQESSADRKKAQAEIDKLRHERLDAAKMFFEATRASYETDTVTFDQLAKANRTLFEVELDLALTPQQRMAAYQRALTAAQAMEAKIKALFDVAARGGEVDKLALAKTERLKFEIELAREKAASAK